MITINPDKVKQIKYNAINTEYAANVEKLNKAITAMMLNGKLVDGAITANTTLLSKWKEALLAVTSG